MTQLYNAGSTRPLTLLNKKKLLAQGFVSVHV